MKNFAIQLIGAASLLCSGAAWTDNSFETGLRLKQEGKFAQAAAAFRQTTANEPKNTKAWQQLATVEGWLSHFDSSASAWRTALKLDPTQASSHIGLARVLYWQGKRVEALKAMDAAFALDAPNADALLLQGDILLADAQTLKAKAVYLQAQALAPTDATIAKKVASAEPAKEWRLDAGFVADRFSATRGAESSAYLQLGKRLSDDTSLYVRTDQYNSYNKVDTGLSAGGYFRVAPWYLLNAELGANLNTANFRPSLVALLNSEFLVQNTLQPLLGLRHMRYDDTSGVGGTGTTVGGSVTTITPGVRWVMPSASLELRYGLSRNLDQSNTGMFQAKLSFEQDGVTPYMAFASGEEALPPQRKARIKVFGAGSVWKFNNEWGARIDLTHEDREGFYTHNSVGVGVSRFF